MAADLLLAGIGGADIGHTILRAVAGMFFVISGYHKLFNRERHATLVETLRADKVPCVGFCQWWVPGVEFSAGAALVVGFLTPVAALGLFVVCLTATCVDGIKRIPAWHPINRADWLDCLLYLPEVVYGLILGYLVLAGAGPWSIDAEVLAWIASGS